MECKIRRWYRLDLVHATTTIYCVASKQLRLINISHFNFMEIFVNVCFSMNTCNMVLVTFILKETTISHFKGALAPSTSPFPCPIAKQIHTILVLLGLVLVEVIPRYWHTKYHALDYLNYLEYPSLQTMCVVGMYPFFCKYSQCNLNTCWTSNVSWIMS
jgi:hypothetical protein